MQVYNEVNGTGSGTEQLGWALVARRQQPSPAGFICTPNRLASCCSSPSIDPSPAWHISRLPQTLQYGWPIVSILITSNRSHSRLQIGDPIGRGWQELEG